MVLNMPWSVVHRPCAHPAKPNLDPCYGDFEKEGTVIRCDVCREAWQAVFADGKYQWSLVKSPFTFDNLTG